MNKDPTRHLIGIDSHDNNNKIVGVYISKKLTNSREAQIAFWMTCNLIIRLDPIITIIKLYNSDAIILMDGVIHGISGGGNFGFEIQKQLKQINSVSVEIVNDSDNSDTLLDFVIAIGDDDIRNKINTTHSYSVSCQGWWAYFSASSKKSILSPADDNPIGAIAAACIVSGEVFKVIIGEETILEPMYFSSYNFQNYTELKSHILSMANPPFPKDITIPNTQIIGAGAVAHGVSFILLYLNQIHGELMIIDRKENEVGKSESIKKSNLNRYMLLDKHDIGDLKAKVLSKKFMNFDDLKVTTFNDGLAKYINQGGQLEYVISCIDNNQARHDIQDNLPKKIVGGSTLKLRSQINIYDLSNGTACLKCYNEIEIRETDMEIIKRLQELPEITRWKAAKEHVVDYLELEEYLSDPKCATIKIQQFAELPPREFSVGFVSLFSGILLASEYIKEFTRYLCPSLNLSDYTDFRYPFITNKPILGRSNPKDDCDCMKIEAYRS